MSKIIGLKKASDIQTMIENESDSVPQFFQAIGLLKGVLVKNENDNDNNYSIVIKSRKYPEGHTFPISIKKTAYKAFMIQIKQGEILDKNLYYRVYPKLMLIPKQDPQIMFVIESWGTEPLDIMGREVNLGEFIIRGIWQFIPQYRYPVVSISRNWQSKADKDKQAKSGEKFRSIHVPLLWKDSEVRAFKFKTQQDRDKQPDRYFVEVLAKFLPQFNSFGCIKLLARPTQDIPRYIKPISAKNTAKETKHKAK